MWLLYARSPQPDAPYWLGRRWLAVADALGWPWLWLIVLSHAPRPIGIAVPVLTVVTALCAVQRLHRAWWINHRYQFTTWVWGRIVIVLLLVGMILRLMLAA